MSEFMTTLDVRMLPETEGGARWMLLAPLVYDSETLGTVVVPAGFVTDFVSFEPLKDVGQRAAVVHDYLYSDHGTPRETADTVLREALLVVGVDAMLADAMYDAVRLFGASHKTGG